MMGYGDFGWMGGFGWLWRVLVWAVVIALVFWGAAALFGTRRRAAEPTPLDVLKQRYAAGEITAAEYEQTNARSSETSTRNRKE
jgi:putative membrane protein